MSTYNKLIRRAINLKYPKLSIEKVYKPNTREYLDGQMVNITIEIDCFKRKRKGSKKLTYHDLDIGMTCTHFEFYNHKEIFEIMGIRKDEVELEGDFSGMFGLKQKSWMSIKGLKLK